MHGTQRNWTIIICRILGTDGTGHQQERPQTTNGQDKLSCVGAEQEGRNCNCQLWAEVVGDLVTVVVVRGVVELFVQPGDDGCGPSGRHTLTRICRRGHVDGERLELARRGRCRRGRGARLERAEGGVRVDTGSRTVGHTDTHGRHGGQVMLTFVVLVRILVVARVVLVFLFWIW